MSFAVSYIAGGCFVPLLVRKTVCEFVANELEEFVLRLIGTCEVGYTAIVFGTLSSLLVVGVFAAANSVVFFSGSSPESYQRASEELDESV